MSAAIWRDLFRLGWLGTAGLNLRPVWGPEPGPLSLVLQKHPIWGMWAEAQFYSALFCSYSVASEQLQLF
jgi:hypothetical protein